MNKNNKVPSLFGHVVLEMSGRAKFTNLLFWSVKNGNSFLRPNDQLDLSRDGPICLDEGYVYLKCTWLNNQSTQVKEKKKKNA